MDTLGATPALVPPSDECPPIYRPRNPRASPLFQLFETHYETIKSVWEERFERQYGFLQGRVAGIAPSPVPHQYSFPV